jgi:type IV secretion system protein VirD4
VESGRYEWWYFDAHLDDGAPSSWELEAKRRRHRLLLMLDEFLALGRLDFFESALAFMAGYGLKSFLIAPSLNQIWKAYGQNNSILDNCHVRVSFASNDERTAKRVSDALGTATEMRAMKNYAGHRPSPWLGHLMVPRQRPRGRCSLRAR